MYHSIDYNKEFFTVTPENFARQMSFLYENNFNIIKLAELEYLKEANFKKKTVILTFDDGYKDNYLNAFPVLQKFNFPATIFISSGLIGKEIKANKGTVLKILNQREIKELARSGLIEIGSHGHRHIKLSSIPEVEVEDELKISKRNLEETAEREVRSFAYPWGDYNDGIQNIAKKYYNNICTVDKGRIDRNLNKFALRRNSIDSQVNFTQFKGIVKFGRI